MPGIPSSVRLPRAGRRIPRFAPGQRIERSRRQAAERAYQRMVAQRHRPRPVDVAPRQRGF